MLQPLVENAIFHGVEPADHFCKIVISATAEDGVLHLVVEDNGVGMDEQRLAVLNGQVESADKGGIGAANVRSRIKLVYGEKLHSGARGGAPDPERCQRGGAHFPNYLSSLFMRQLSVGFVDCVNQMKMKRAYELLETGNYLIYEVANRLGYENAYYFSKVFRKYIGCTPKEYQARGRMEKGK